MSSLSIDEKMSLIEKMRSQSAQAPQSYIREQSRYHSVNNGSYNHDKTGYPSGSISMSGDGLDEITDGFRFLKLRLFVCLLIFSGFFGLYKTGFEIKGHKVTEVNETLQENILPESLRDSLETLSQKLTESVMKTQSD